MRANNQMYARTISKMTDVMEQTGDQVDPYFQTIKKALQLGNVAEMDQSQLAEIKGQFQQATEQYRSIEKEIVEVKAPVKLIGKHQNLKHDYVQYVDECQKMVDAIDPEAKKIDVEAFNASEKNQEATMAQITKTLTRIMNLLVA
jgi:predicted  nucleic acid-binding Zn-ribbon protein